MATRRAPFWLAAVGFFVLAVMAAPTKAQEGRLLVELNQLEDMEQGCRGAVVFTNEMDMTIQELAIEVAVFDHDERVKNLWLLPARNLAPGKIRVRQFLFQEDSCADIGSILLNDVVNCEVDGDLDPEECLARTSVSSRIDVPFISSAGDEN